MFRHEYTAKIGFTKLLDRTCPKDGGLYASNEHSVCPKCQGALIIPAHKMEDGLRPYCLTEVTLYPLMPQDMKDRHAKRTASAKGLLYIIRLSLWGRYDKERNVVLPDPRTQYLVPKRTIRVLLNNPPTALPFAAKDNTTKLELKYTFDYHSGDQLEFLDAKQEAAAMMAGAVAIPAVANAAVIPAQPSATDLAIAALQAKMEEVMRAVGKNTGTVLPAPNPANTDMVMVEAADYSPDMNTIAQEAIDVDPFVA